MRIFLLIVFPLTFRSFAYFPGMLHVEDAWYVVCLLCLLVVYPAWKIMAGLRFLSFELYALLLIGLSLLIPAIRADQVFGQPLIYGVLARRADVLVVIPLLVFLAIVSKRLKPADIEWTILTLAWLEFAIGFFMLLFVNPASFPADSPGFIGTVNGVLKFTLPADAIYFGMIYHAIAGVRTRRPRHYAIAMVFLATTLTFGDARSATVSVAAVFFYFVYRLRSGRQFSATFIKTAAVVGVVAMVGLVANPTYVTDRLSGFRDAFKVAFTGGEVEDASANARIVETVMAIPYIRNHPFLGNGSLSNQWQGGVHGIIGETFYPDDIGVIGVVYSVGILGGLFYLFQFRYSIWAARQVPLDARSPLYDAVAGTLMFTAIVSLVSGVFVFYSEVTMFYIAIMVGLATLRRKEGMVAMQVSAAARDLKTA